MKKRYRENGSLVSVAYQIIAAKTPPTDGIMRDFGAHSEVRLVAILKSANQTVGKPPPRSGEIPPRPPVYALTRT